MMKEVVLELDLQDDKAKTKVVDAIASCLPGVDFISLDMKEKKLTLTGHVNALQVAKKQEKSCKEVTILLVVPAEKKKEEPKKKEVKNEVVLKLDLEDDEAKEKVMKAASCLSSGVDFFSLDMKEKKLTLTGHVNALQVAKTLEESFKEVKILLVVPAEKKKEEPKKKEVKNKVVLELDLEDDEAKKTVMKAASCLSGVDFFSLDMKEKKLTLTGHVNALRVAKTLEKSFKEVKSFKEMKILLVVPAEKKKEEPKQKEVKNKVVLKLDLKDDEAEEKVRKAAEGLSGVDVISPDMKEKKLTLTGHVNALQVAKTLENSFKEVKILLVVPAEKKKEEPKKKEVKNKVVLELDLEDDEAKKTVMKAASCLSGGTLYWEFEIQY